jgi:hypothetical protein
MNNILDKTIQKASWKKAILFGVLFAVLYALVNFSDIGVAGLLKITGGPNILDFETGYSYEKASGMLAALGPEGRAFYQTRIAPLDYPFPLSYMLFYTALIAVMVKQTALNNRWGYLLFVPVLAMLCDFTENIGIAFMLHNYPDLPVWAVSLSSTFGTLKMIFVVASLVVIGVLAVIFLYSKFRKK